MSFLMFGSVEKQRREIEFCWVHTIYLLSIDAKKEERMAEHFAFSLFTLVFSSHYLHFFSWEMIFWQSFCDNLFDNFISHTHIIFLLYLSITLVSVSLSNFLCKLVVVTKIITQMIVQITHLFFLWIQHTFFYRNLMHLFLT